MVRLVNLAAAALAVTLASTASRAQTGSDGKLIFRFDTFGDEQLWTETLRMQHVIPTVSPATALSVGLKVDSDALPQTVIDAIRTMQVNLNDPAVTIQLLKLNAVVGVIGKVAGANDNLATVGITCALCHSTVDDSIAPGIGKRLDGWPNRSLNVGAIIALSPAIVDKSTYTNWGPGKFDPRLHAFDGKNFITLNSPSLPVVIPPAYGLQGVGFATFTADGSISYWNNYVGVAEMGGQGSFSDPRIGLHIVQNPDLVTPELPALLKYQLSLPAPGPTAGSYDAAAALQGGVVFAAACASCHKPPTYTDVLSGPNPNVPVLHAPAETGMEPVYASRSATGMYRTTPLRALWQHPPYFHDGSAPTLLDVVNHYNARLQLGLTDQQKADLVEFLKSL